MRAVWLIDCVFVLVLVCSIGTLLYRILVFSGLVEACCDAVVVLMALLRRASTEGLGMRCDILRCIGS